MEGLYSIHGYDPPDIDEIPTGGFGFEIKINRDFAKKALQTELPEKGYGGLERMANLCIRRLWPEETNNLIHYSFVENDEKKLTCLLHYCSVPGSRCCLYIEGFEIQDILRENNARDFISYASHNVDNHTQAYGLLSIWLRWFNGVENHLKNK